VMAVNVKSIYLMSKFAIPEIAKQGGGAIVNTGSGWGIKADARDFILRVERRGGQHDARPGN